MRLAGKGARTVRGPVATRASCYSRNQPLECMVRDARMLTIGGSTAQILRTIVASRLLGRRLPQTRDGYLNAMSQK
jgi:alkylation response protein AidB-like acyl-CoA dehydrogenase